MAKVGETQAETEEEAMFDPSKILSWLDENFQSVRRSRRSALAAIVYGAMQMQGTGVLALGRAMAGPVCAKHRIKRVDRFLGNAGVEADALGRGLFALLRGADRSPSVLVDWTDRKQYKQLVFALAKDGRAMPFLCLTVKKGDFEGANHGVEIEAEREGLRRLEAMCPPGVVPTLIADRGFGNARWLGDIEKRGWRYVQRLAKNHYMETEGFAGVLSELGIRRGWRPKDWGWGVLGEEGMGDMRLATVYDREAQGPWYIVTNLPEIKAQRVTALYAKRMWIEAMFRDLKSRKLGLGIDDVELTTAERTTRHFLIVAIAYILLCAFGAIAETKKFAESLKANTVKHRTLALATIGNNLLKLVQRTTIPTAIRALARLPA